MQQLQLRKGYIRCINCAHIFDGYEAVVPAAEPTVPPAAGPARPSYSEPSFSASHAAAAPSPGEPRFVVSAPEHAALQPASQPASRSDSRPAFRSAAPSRSAADIPIRTRVEGPVEARAFTVRDPDHRLDDAGRHTVGDPAPAADHGEGWRAPDPGLYVEPRSGRTAGPEFADDEERSGLGLGGVLWSLLVVLGLAAAALQAAYIYRVQIADELPFLRPALERYCETLGCTVEYPRRIAQIAIMDSSLQALRGGEEAADGSRMTLSVVLRNNYDKPQQWPTLSVELVDFSGTVAVRRLLAPSDYLPELSLQRPFPARSEVRVSVPITVKGAQINGYQLDKFFP